MIERKVRPSPFFAVVIPTFNQAEFLRTALTSVLNQTFEEFEVVVVNNESTDATLDVTSDFDDPRVKVINFQNHGVIGAARNVGIKASTAPYVAFLDSDDSWYSNKLEKVAEAFEENPEIGLVCHDQEVIRSGRVIRRSRYGPRREFRGNMHDFALLVGNGPATSATVVARHHIDEVGGFSEAQDLITVEDGDLWIRLANTCQFRFLNEVLGTLNLHTASASSNVELHFQAELALLDKHFGGIKGPHKLSSGGSVRHRYASAYFGAARQYQQRGEFKNSLLFFTKSLRTYPLHATTYGGLALLIANKLRGQS